MSTTSPMRPSTSGTSRSVDVKRKGSFRSLMSIFRRSNSSKSDLNTYPKDVQNSAASSVSTTFLPPEIQLPVVGSPDVNDEPLHSESSASSASLSADPSTQFSRSPSTSSASTLSTDNGSDVSTPMTTPSNSSLCVLMKASDGSTETTADHSSTPCSQLKLQASQEPINRNRRAFDVPSEKQPSASPGVDDNGSPSFVPVMSNPLEDTEDIRQMKAKRRNSIGRVLLRRAKSNPDFVAPDDGGGIPSIPRIPQNGTQERPVSFVGSGSGYSGLGRRLSRRGSTKGIPGLDKDLIPDPVREREEHLLILGADPMGSSFYLYPTSKQEAISRRKSVFASQPTLHQPNRYNIHSDDRKRRNWSGLPGDGGSGMSGTTRRPRGPMRPTGSFRPTVANQVIMEEGQDFGEPHRIPSPSRRHSAHPGQYDNWRAHQRPIAPSYLSESAPECSTASTSATLMTSSS